MKTKHISNITLLHYRNTRIYYHDLSYFLYIVTKLKKKCVFGPTLSKGVVRGEEYSPRQGSRKRRENFSPAKKCLFTVFLRLLIFQKKSFFGVREYVRDKYVLISVAQVPSFIDNIYNTSYNDTRTS